MMRALKNETAKLNIAVSVVAPGITVTPILGQSREMQVSPSQWADGMKKYGVPINKAESIALAVGYLMNGGLQSNGKGLLVQSDRMWDIEGAMAKSRPTWMSQEMLDLFKGGRDAPLFNRIEKGKI
jgi:NAD(P)-dependent dehydrogenase (short-subunit alcohol dehydrogenase family)